MTHFRHAAAAYDEAVEVMHALRSELARAELMAYAAQGDADTMHEGTVNILRKLEESVCDQERTVETIRRDMERAKAAFFKTTTTNEAR